MEEEYGILDETTGLFSSYVEQILVTPMEQSVSQGIIGDETRMECSEITGLEPETSFETEHGCSAESIVINMKLLTMVEFLKKDQTNKIDSSADTRIVCADGWVPLHRYMLMAVSPWIYELLINEDTSELAIIHMPDVKIENLVPIIYGLYNGNALYNKCSEENISQIFKMLGINTENVQFENPVAENEVFTLRFYKHDRKTTQDTTSLTNDAIETGLEQNENACEVSIEEIENRGPKVMSRIQIDKAETAKFKSIRVELSKSGSPHEDPISHTCNALQVVNLNPQSIDVNSDNVLDFAVADSIIPQVEQVLTSSENTKDVLTPKPQPKAKGRKQKRNWQKKKKNSKTKKSAKIQKINRNQTIIGHEIGSPENVVENEAPQNIEQEILLEQECPLNTSNPTHNSGDDVILSEEIIHSTISISNLSSSYEEIVNCDDENASGNLNEEEDIKYVKIENDPSGCHEDISKLSVENLHKLLTQCPVCTRNYIDMKGTSRCLRMNHGLRRCWVCLKLVPVNPHDFLHHNLQHIIPGTKGKVPCPFCHEIFDYQRGVNAHCSYHFSMLLPTGTKGFIPQTSSEHKKTPETSKRRLTNKKIVKSKSSTSVAVKPKYHVGQSIENNRIVEKCTEVITVSADDDEEGDLDYVPTRMDLELAKNIFNRKKRPRTRTYSSSAKKVPNTI